MKVSKRFAALAASLVSVTLAGVANADVIIDPSSVSSPEGSYPAPFNLPNLINQSGLSAGYTSGVTDFASFTATTTHTSSDSKPGGFTDASGLPQTITFTFASPIKVDAIAIWAVDNIGSITQFSLSGDGGAIAGVFNAAGDNGTGVDPAQDFSFGSVLTSQITMTVLDTAGGTGLTPGLGAVAFGSGGVPEPATWTLMLAGAGAAGFALRRRRSRAAA